jgi:hypothetical protein
VTASVTFCLVKSRELRCALYVTRTGDKMLIGKTLGSPRRCWQDNVEIHLREGGCENGKKVITF